jgi:DNA-binding MarR family transcriptional regulator
MDVQKLWEHYILETPQARVSATSFGVWLIKNDGKDLPKSTSRVPIPGAVHQANDGNMTAIFIGRLYRFLKQATKEVLLQKGLNNMDEFALIATLFFRPGSTKTALLRQNIIELTTGSEILKRLVTKKIITDQTDKADKRINRLSLTKKGRALFLSCAAGLKDVDDPLAPLSPAERQSLHHLLNLLDGYHSQKHHISQVATIMQNANLPLGS